MERSVVLIIGNEEYDLGTVKELLSQEKHTALIRAIQGVIEEMVFSDDGNDYTVCSIEVR